MKWASSVFVGWERSKNNIGVRSVCVFVWISTRCLGSGADIIYLSFCHIQEHGWDSYLNSLNTNIMLKRKYKQTKTLFTRIANQFLLWEGHRAFMKTKRNGGGELVVIVMNNFRCHGGWWKFQSKFLRIMSLYVVGDFLWTAMVFLNLILRFPVEMALEVWIPSGHTWLHLLWCEENVVVVGRQYN